MTDAQKLADAFVAVITDWATPEQLAEIRRRNATPEYDASQSCATHDFFDANEAMDLAFEKTFGRKPATLVDGEDKGGANLSKVEDDIALWNTAWDLAKAQGFTAHDG